MCLLGEFWKLGKKIAGCICCLMCAGPVLIIIGIVFLASAVSAQKCCVYEQLG